MITVNGRSRDLPDGTALATVVAELLGEQQGRGVAVAVNGAVVPRRSWPDTNVRSGDRVEIINATQGG